MKFIALLVALQSGDALQPQKLNAPLDEVKLKLPAVYNRSETVSLKWVRLPTRTSPDVVTLKMEYYPVKMPPAVKAPVDADLMKVDTTLNNFKLTASVATWRGRQVPMARYEGFVQGNLGVYGRMVWLPLGPGTVVLHLYAEPVWGQTMERDWDLLLANIDGPIVEMTLRERAPGRWMAAKITAAAGVLVFLVGIIMILARMNEAIGGAIVYLGLLIPVIPMGWALFHHREGGRGLLVSVAGLGIFGISLFLER